MSKPPAPPEPIARKVMSLPASLWERVNDWRFAQHIGTEVAAIRRLIEIGLEAESQRAEAQIMQAEGKGKRKGKAT